MRRVILFAYKTVCRRRQIVVQAAFEHVDQTRSVRLNATRLSKSANVLKLYPKLAVILYNVIVTRLQAKNTTHIQ